MVEKRGLGRGLSALMADADVESLSGEATDTSRAAERAVPIELIHPNPEQPRRDFNEADLEELAASIRERGIIQPLIVRVSPTESSSYQIVAGERRWRAAQAANVHEVPVVIREFTDTEVLEVAIIENIQRSDLNPVEEAMGYRQLQDRFGHTQDQLSTALGKSRSHIANLLRLLKLPDEVLQWLREGQLSSGHARALITSSDPTSLARTVIARQLSVRETEALAKKAATGDTRKNQMPSSADDKDADTRMLENDLSAALGLKVVISHKPGQSNGSMTINYRNFEQLDDICRRLARGS